jgi:two-component system, sensor histidine kinase
MDMAADADRDSGTLEPRRRILWLGAAGAVLVLVMAAVAILQLRQNTLLSVTVRYEDDNLVFNLFQLENEYLRLREQWQRAIFEPPIDRDALQLRYEIFISRVGLMHSRRAAATVPDRAAFDETLRRAETFIEHADRVLATGARAPLDRQALLSLRGELDAMAPQIHATSLSAAYYVAEQIIERSQAVQRNNRIGIALIALLSASTVLFAVIGMRQMRRLETLAARLREARRAADAANQAKSVFLANMSHELRTPLNAVLGFADLLKRERDLNPRQVRGLNLIEQGGQHLLALINDVLDLARIEAGRMELYPEAVELPAFLRVVADVMRVRAEQKDLRFELDAPADLPRAVCLDEQRLRQVLLNLLGNAIKFTDAGTVSLRARCSASGEGRVRLHFEVRDSGIGIDAAQLPRLFQPFEQVSDAKRRSGGTGLGLAISRQLVRSMDGDIEVASTLGQGSAFSFDIDVPLAQAAVAEAADEHSVTGYRGPRRKVLIVDDVAENRALAVDFLESLGFTLAEASDGCEGLEMARAIHPDLIVVDNRMPVMSGLELTRLLRAQAEFASVPIIAVSASATREDRERSLSAGVDAFLTKPLDLRELLQRMGPLMKLEWDYGDAEA